MRNTLLLILLFFTCTLQAQSVIAKNIIHIEAAGVGGYGSINYERIIPIKSKFKIGARVGLSTYNLKDFTNKFNPDLILPIAITGLFGYNHKLEFGVGQTLSNVVRASPTNWEPERKTNLHGNFTIGYRYQKDEGGIMLRCSYSPIIEFYKYFRNWGAVGIGYAF